MGPWAGEITHQRWDRAAKEKRIRKWGSKVIQKEIGSGTAPKARSTYTFHVGVCAKKL